MTTLIIEHIKVSELPPHWAQQLNTSPEQTVTVRIETEITAKPLVEVGFVTNDPAFGIWRDREDMTDVEAYVRKVRMPRYDRDGSRNRQGKG